MGSRCICILCKLRGTGEWARKRQGEGREGRSQEGALLLSEIVRLGEGLQQEQGGHRGEGSALGAYMNSGKKTKKNK